MARFQLLLDGLIPAFILIHLYVAPYSKIEEAFNLEATHDILKYGTSKEAIAHHYDHVVFPGPVPRSFVGALALAAFSRPCLPWHDDTLQTQIIGNLLLD